MAAKVVSLRKSPAVAPGSGVTEYLHDSVETVRSDAVNYNDASPEVVFRVPANTLVEKVIVHVATTFDGTLPSISLGTQASPSLLVGTNDVDVTVTGYTAINKPTNFTSDTDLKVTIVSNGTQGQVRFWIQYRSRSNFLA